MKAPHRTFRRGMIAGRILIGVAAAGVATGVLATSLLPVIRTANSVNASALTVTALEAAADGLAGRSTDVDGDGTTEAPAFDVASGLPAGVGYVPAALTDIPQRDGYGNRIGACAWNHGTLNAASGTRLMGLAANFSQQPSIGVVSGGPDGVIETGCPDIASNLAIDDDKVRFVTAAQQQQLSSAWWTASGQIGFTTTASRGWLGVGTDGAPAAPLDVNGDIAVSGAATTDGATITSGITAATASAPNTTLTTQASATSYSGGDVVTDQLQLSPTNSGTCNAGTVNHSRLNAATGVIEVCDGTAWRPQEGASAVVSDTNFLAVSNAEHLTTYTSNGIRIAGIPDGSTVTASASGGTGLTIIKNGVASGVSTTANSFTDSLALRITTPAMPFWTQTVTVTLTAPGKSWTWTVTVRAQDVAPSSFSYSSLTVQDTNASVTSAAVAISGFDPTIAVSVSGDPSARLRINGGAWVTGGSISPGDTVQLQMATSPSEATTRTITLVAGSASTTWSATTATYSWNSGTWGSCSGDASWVTGSWGSCSASCGGGTQTRTNSCPATNGTQTRSVTCLRSDGASRADSYCAAVKPATSQSCTGSCGTQPATSQSCNTQSCCTPSNQVTSYGSCSASCGGGTRTVYWSDGCGSTWTTSQSCNTQACCCSTCWELVGWDDHGSMGQCNYQCSTWDWGTHCEYTNAYCHGYEIYENECGGTKSKYVKWCGC